MVAPVVQVSLHLVAGTTTETNNTNAGTTTSPTVARAAYTAADGAGAAAHTITQEVKLLVITATAIFNAGCVFCCCAALPRHIFKMAKHTHTQNKKYNKQKKYIAKQSKNKQEQTNIKNLTCFPEAS
jgi:hypothetical protein